MFRLPKLLALGLALAAPVTAQHTAKVHALAYSPAGKLIVTGGEDGRLVTWDASTGAKISQTRVGRHPWPVRDLAFAPQGNWLVAGGGDRIKVFRAGADRPRLDLEVPSKVAAVAFGPFLRVAYYSTGGLAAVQGALGGAWHRRTELPEGQVWAADLSPDASIVALGFDEDKSVRLFRAANGETLRTLPESFPNSISALAFSPQGDKLAVGCYDHRVRIYDVASGRRLANFVAHRAPVYALAWSPDGEWLASGAKNARPRAYDPAGAEEPLALHTWQGQGRVTEAAGITVEAMAFSPDGATIAYGGSSSRIGLWRPARGERMASQHGAGSQALPSVK